MFECNPTVVFDDNNLPDGECDDIYRQIQECAGNIATGWSVGGESIVEFPEIAGYPVGGDFETKYYMVQMHYDNPKKMSNRRDSSGIRFHLGNELRQHDLGYLTFGTDSNAVGIAIPPGANRFILNSYCPVSATNQFPKSGITVTTAFPHTHLQGSSVWMKIIRDKKAVDYLFNAESYDFNYQFENRFPKPVQLYPVKFLISALLFFSHIINSFIGDEFATLCIYNTMNKDEITLGGERAKDEMCLHMFTYYPRMNDFYSCINANSEKAWKQVMNATDPLEDYMKFQQLFRDLKWTPESVRKWQEFYDNASRLLFGGRAGNYTLEELPRLPEYIDLKPSQCKKDISSKGIHETSFISLTIISFLTTLITNFFIKQ
ncbi:unnamed protein product [Adineta steineri]|uniref:Uncharacterized protein n=1 Tax=Adineta steineri TaxID=433720 RepID=A0A819G2J4_9BILA|nr:unnamed protein product [Adineta steineri]CAF3874784.1 unnamed protein product [Adineta steineri]